MTDDRHSIWLDAPSWFCRPNSTDWQMKLSFVREFSDLQASIVDSWFFNLVYSALYVSIHFLSGRVYEWFTHVCACLRAWVLKRRGAEIVISQGLEPPLPLLEALSKLRDEGLRDFSLTVVSDCVDGKIEFPDWVDHKVSVPHEEAMRLMQSAQVFVMPSFVESYGLVYLESLASGCVTMVPDQDPQREFVDSGRAGLVVDPRDVSEMVEKLRPILQDQLSVAGRHHYEAALSQRVVRAKWRQAIQSLG